MTGDEIPDIVPKKEISKKKVRRKFGKSKKVLKKKTKKEIRQEKTKEGKAKVKKEKLGKAKEKKAKVEKEKAKKERLEKEKLNEEKARKESLKKFPTLKIKSERDIAMDFAQKVYQKFDKIIKSVVLFGSTMKNTQVVGSDIDIILIVDDAMIKFDEKLVMWYREELGKIIQENPYNQDLHINTVKLTTWWEDLSRGDPTIINVIRYGDALIDFGGFFNPMKILLQQGKIKLTPEAIYTCLNRVPGHIVRSKVAEMGSIEGAYWAMMDSAQALLMAVNVLPPSPEHIPVLLKQHFVDKGLLKMYYVRDFNELYDLHKKIIHGDVRDINGDVIDGWQNKAEAFLQIVLKLINEIV